MTDSRYKDSNVVIRASCWACFALVLVLLRSKDVAADCSYIGRLVLVGLIATAIATAYVKAKKARGNGPKWLRWGRAFNAVLPPFSSYMTWKQVLLAAASTIIVLVIGFSQFNTHCLPSQQSGIKVGFGGIFASALMSNNSRQ